MPVKRFWNMSQGIDRIEAQRALRNLSVALAGQSGEGAKKCREMFMREIGSVLIDKPEFDRTGFESLKKLTI